VQVAPDGTKFKMLIAPLLLGMDGRINLNVAGNVMAAGGTHSGSAGWGGHEVNPTKVAAGNAALVAEWRHLILGTGTIAGKCGPAPRLPVSPGAWGGFMLRENFPVALNGVYDPGSVAPNPAPGTPSPRYAFPNGATALTVYPQYPLTAVGSPPTYLTNA